MSAGRASFTSSSVRKPFCLPREMRRSSSPSFVSSLIRLDSLRASRPVFQRLRDAARHSVHDLAVLVQGAQLRVMDSGGGSGARLRLGDGAEHRALALQALFALEMDSELPDERGVVIERPLLDE